MALTVGSEWHAMVIIDEMGNGDNGYNFWRSHAIETIVWHVDDKKDKKKKN